MRYIFLALLISPCIALSCRWVGQRRAVVLHEASDVFPHWLHHALGLSHTVADLEVVDDGRVGCTFAYQEHQSVELIHRGCGWHCAHVVLGIEQVPVVACGPNGPGLEQPLDPG